MTAANGTRTTEDRYRRRQEFDRATFGTHCVNCFPNNCPVYVFAKDGKVVFEEAAAVLGTIEPGVPDMNPMICQKGLAWSRQMDAPDRILHPLRRAGERGEGRWERISWDEALVETADAILDAIGEIGPEAVVLEGTPEIAATIPAARFMGALGGTVLDVDATINDFWAGYQAVFGKFTFASSIDDFFHSDVLLIWHSNPAYTMIPAFHYLVEARYKGATVALISPDVSPSHCHVDYHVPVRHGTDGALALAMCQVVLAEGLADLRFASEQTDLSFLVRTDTGEFLRESNLRADGRDDRFFQWHPEKGMVAADPASLRLDFEPLLAGTLEVRLASGDRVVVEPLLARVRRELDEHYTPEAAARVCEAHPDTIRMLARKVARGRTHIILGAGVREVLPRRPDDARHAAAARPHRQLGKEGQRHRRLVLLDVRRHTASRWRRRSRARARSARDLRRLPGDGRRPARAGSDADRRARRPTRSGGMVGPARGMMPPAFFWYWHAGYRERWNRPEWNDPTMARSFDDYWQRSHRVGLVAAIARQPPPDTTAARVARNRRQHAASHARRTERAARTTVAAAREDRQHGLPHVADGAAFRHRAAGDPALREGRVQHADAVDMFLTIPTAAVPPAGEARTEWEVLAALCGQLGERAKARGLESYTERRGMAASNLTTSGAASRSTARSSPTKTPSPRWWPTRWRREPPGGHRPGGVAREGLPALRRLGLPRHSRPTRPRRSQGTKRTPARAATSSWPSLPDADAARAVPTSITPGSSRRGEALPAHKETPTMGGDHPFALTSGHNRWSVHSMNTTNPLLLRTHRGQPFVIINDRRARRAASADDAPVRVWNDMGEFFVPATVPRTAG